MNKPVKKKARGGNSLGLLIPVALLWVAVHSLLASRQAKQTVEKLAGPRYRNGLYRFVFSTYSYISVLLYLLWMRRLPDRELYRVPAPLSWLMMLGQAGFFGFGLTAAIKVGLGNMNGTNQLGALAEGMNPRPEPEAQGPLPAGDDSMEVVGPFRYSRHPLNLFPIGVLLLWPRMTVNQFVLSLLSSAYLVLGSFHEEYRLKRAYGEAYSRYQGEAPFMLPLGSPFMNNKK